MVQLPEVQSGYSWLGSLSEPDRKFWNDVAARTLAAIARREAAGTLLHLNLPAQAGQTAEASMRATALTSPGPVHPRFFLKPARVFFMAQNI